MSGFWKLVAKPGGQLGGELILWDFLSYRLCHCNIAPQHSLSGVIPQTALNDPGTVFIGHSGNGNP